MPQKINDGLTNKQRYILLHKERLLIVWREEKRKSYKKNRDKNISRNKAWRDANPWYEKQRSAIRLAALNEKRRADPQWAKEHDKQHYEKWREYHRAYNKKNAERRLAATREWYKRMPESSRAKQAAKRNRRRSLLLNAVGRFTSDDVLEKLHLQRGKCYWCKHPHGKVYHVDHVIPLARGGGNDKTNIVIACKTCNLSKRDKLPSEFAGLLL